MADITRPRKIAAPSNAYTAVLGLALLLLLGTIGLVLIKCSAQYETLFSVAR